MPEDEHIVQHTYRQLRANGVVGASLVRHEAPTTVQSVTTLADRDRTRTAFLLALYEATDGDSMESAHAATVGGRIGLGAAETEQTVQWLADRDLADRVAFGGSIGITARGVDEAERLLRGGAEVPYSVIVLSPDEHRAVEAFLTAYRRAEAAGVLGLSGEALLEADAEAATIEAQLRSPKPKRRVIAASLRGLRDLGLNIVGSAGYQGIVELIKLIG